MSEDWKPGDLALCVNVAPHVFYGPPPLTKGVIYTVAEIEVDASGQIPGLRLVEVDPHPCAYFWAGRFRKLRPHTPDAEDRETIELLKRQRAPEPVA